MVRQGVDGKEREKPRVEEWWEASFKAEASAGHCASLRILLVACFFCWYQRERAHIASVVLWRRKTNSINLVQFWKGGVFWLHLESGEERKRRTVSSWPIKKVCWTTSGLFSINSSADVFRQRGRVFPWRQNTFLGWRMISGKTKVRKSKFIKLLNYKLLIMISNNPYLAALDRWGPNSRKPAGIFYKNLNLVYRQFQKYSNENFELKFLNQTGSCKLTKGNETCRSHRSTSETKIKKIHFSN